MSVAEFLLLACYTLIATGAVVMTLREHNSTPNRRLVDLGAGVAACLAWPLLIVAVLYEMRRQPA